MRPLLDACFLVSRSVFDISHFFGLLRMVGEIAEPLTDDQEMSRVNRWDTQHRLMNLLDQVLSAIMLWGKTWKTWASKFDTGSNKDSKDAV